MRSMFCAAAGPAVSVVNARTEAPNIARLINFVMSDNLPPAAEFACVPAATMAATAGATQVSKVQQFFGFATSRRTRLKCLPPPSNDVNSRREHGERASYAIETKHFFHILTQVNVGRITPA